MHATVTIIAEYTSEDATPFELEAYLEDAIANAIGNGLLTGPYNETEVDQWEVSARVME